MCDNVYIKSDRIHYLSKEAMVPYEDLLFLTKCGQEVKMSALVLAALKSPIIKSMASSQDFESMWSISKLY